MSTKKFDSVFAAHPDAEELYVVNGMPFLQEADAKNFAFGTEHKVEKVSRAGKTEDTGNTEDTGKTGKSKSSKK